MSNGWIFKKPGKKNLYVGYWGPGKDGRLGQRRESAGTTNEKKAQKFLDDRIREVANHRKGIRPFQGSRPDRITVDELLDALVADLRERDSKSLYGFFGKDGKGGHGKPIRAFFGRRRASEVTPELVSKYIAQRREGRKNATVNRGLELLQQAFRLAVKRRTLVLVPEITRLSERGNARQGFFERAEFEAVVRRLSPPVDDVVRFAHATGWRRGEILALRWDWVDRNAREIRLPDSKNGDSRVIPLDGPDWQLVERRWQARSYPTANGWVGTSAHVFHRDGKPIPGSTLGNEWRRACRAAGLHAKLFHDLRRTAVRDMIRGGVSQHVAMAISGHKTPSMFQRYNITDGRDKLEALRLRRAYVESQAEKA